MAAVSNELTGATSPRHWVEWERGACERTDGLRQAAGWLAKVPAAVPTLRSGPLWGAGLAELTDVAPARETAGAPAAPLRESLSSAVDEEPRRGASERPARPATPRPMAPSLTSADQSAVPVADAARLARRARVAALGRAAGESWPARAAGSGETHAEGWESSPHRAWRPSSRRGRRRNRPPGVPRPTDATLALRRRATRPLPRAAAIDAAIDGVALSAEWPLLPDSTLQSPLAGEPAPETVLLGAAVFERHIEPAPPADRDTPSEGRYPVRWGGGEATVEGPPGTPDTRPTPNRHREPFPGPLDAPSRFPSLPALKPPPTVHTDPQPVATITAEATRNLEDPEELELLAGKIKRILDEEARRYGIDV